MIRYGKPSGPLLKLKSNFLRENATLAAHVEDLCKLYAEQPRREACKNCDAPLDAPAFTKLGVDYLICPRCGHLNGAHEDTEAFCQAVYTDDGGAEYAKTYSATDEAAYRSRVRDIYIPKVEFLRDALMAEGLDPATLTYTDLGAGSGYFVSALAAMGLTKISGYEVSESQVELANRLIDGAPLIRHDLDEITTIAGTIDASVVSMIGVLEHLRQPRDVLQALASNSEVRYLYLSVPLFSPCVFLEMVFPQVFNRQLSAGHTHLYTESSLDALCQEFKFERAAEWWFGTDIVDLYRSVRVTLEQQAAPDAAIATWADQMLPIIDGMQRVIDEKHLASEVHMLLRNTNDAGREDRDTPA